MSKALLVEVNASKGSEVSKTKAVQEKSDAMEYLYKYLQRRDFSRRPNYKDCYSLGTSCPSMTHLDSAKGERSTSGCTQAN